MPKIKTQSSVKKRFKITGNGKIRRHKATMSHYLGKKSQKRIRQNRRGAAVAPEDLKQILRLFGR